MRFWYVHYPANRMHHTSRCDFVRVLARLHTRHQEYTGLLLGRT
jgi:hypothetical protein